MPTDNTQVLTELFEMLPKNLEEVGVADGEKIYSNTEIAEKVYSMASRKIRIPQIVEKLREGIQTKKIMIGYTDKSKFNFIFRRMVGWTSTSVFGMTSGATVGWYSKYDGKIAIVLDKNVTVLGNNVFPIYPILVHELCHMCVTENSENFFESTKRDYLIPYYSRVCSELSGRQVNLRNVNEAARALVIEMESKPTSSRPILVDNAAQIWLDFWRGEGYSSNEAKDFVFTMFSPFAEYFLKKKMKYQYRKNVNNMINIYYMGYDEIGAGSSRSATLPGQEAAFPSEIVSVSSKDFLTRELISAIQRIDMSN